MTAPAVLVKNLSKNYQLGRHTQSRYRTLREALVDACRNVWARGSGPPAEEFWALHDVSFDVRSGEVVGIIGHNGAGKSTLLKILSRITKPAGGRVELHGRVGSLLEVGTGFHPELTGRENIYLNGSILGMSRKEIARQFDQIVDFAEIGRFLDTPVKRYSSGMYVRLAFSVAAHLDPEILLVDEVLAVGDASFQKKCFGRLNDVASGGRTILFVSHNMGAVRSLCDRVIWLSRGSVMRDGPTDEVVDAYLQSTNIRDGRFIDLADEPRSGEWGRRARVTRVTFNDNSPIYHGEPLVARLEFESRGEASGLAPGIGFSNQDGVRLLSIDSDVSTAPERCLRVNLRGAIRSEVEMRLERLDLAPGNYLLDVGIRSGDFNSLDYLAGCALVEILPGPTTPGTIMREGGGVRAPAEWSFPQNPEFEIETFESVAKRAS